jgi:peptidoglycan/xylan/chitin deacetylase (PgdA/CDA1 family)
MNKKYIMLHHLHDKNFMNIKGSISKRQFEKIVKKNLIKNYVYTFDDGLKSQFHIARPILEKYNLKGIFFINSFQFKKKIGYHEVSKFFIKKYYKNIKEYADDFILFSKNKFKINKTQIKNYKKEHPFHTLSEIYIRILRNKNLNLYNRILIKMFKRKKFNYTKTNQMIFMNKSEVINLSKKHIIGLHTHSHLFNLDELNYKTQNKEILLNKKILEKFINKKIFYFSYPVGKYNLQLIKILKKYKIKIAFTNRVNNFKNRLLMPRININTL